MLLLTLLYSSLKICYNRFLQTSKKNLFHFYFTHKILDYRPTRFHVVSLSFIVTHFFVWNNEIRWYLKRAPCDENDVVVDEKINSYDSVRIHSFNIYFFGVWSRFWLRRKSASLMKCLNKTDDKMREKIRKFILDVYWDWGYF